MVKPAKDEISDNSKRTRRAVQSKAKSASVAPPEAPPAEVLTPILSDVKDEGTKKALLAIVSRQEMYKGMLPHPDHAERFELIQPGTFDRLLKIQEKEQDNRHRFVNRQLDGDLTIRKRAQWFAMFGLLILLGAAVWLIVNGHAREGSIILGGTLVSVVAAFLGYQAVSKKKALPKSNETEGKSSS